MRYRVHFKTGYSKVLKADSLRDAQDKALRIWGPWTVIMVTEIRADYGDRWDDEVRWGDEIIEELNHSDQL